MIIPESLINLAIEAEQACQQINTFTMQTACDPVAAKIEGAIAYGTRCSLTISWREISTGYSNFLILSLEE